MRYLTKSRFKMALECPTKLFYTKKAKTYADSNLDDPFLIALAKGGFQVGELSKCYYPGGHDITTLDYEEALKQTNELLKQEDVIIFEAAIKFENLFIRVDILEKKGNHFNLIEVKSKSFHPDIFESEIYDSRKLKKEIKSIKSTWKEYIYDLAFQSYVLENAFPGNTISNYLMCADKSKKASINGLNQKFVLTEVNGRTGCEVIGDVSKEALGKEILGKIDCDEYVQLIKDECDAGEDFGGLGFKKAILFYSEMYEKDERIMPIVGSKCKKCEFRCSEGELKSGFDECWRIAKKLSPEELTEPFVFDVWNFRGAEKLIEKETFLMKEIGQTDLKVTMNDDGSFSSSERQLVQIQKEKNKDPKPEIILTGLEAEFDQFVYPLHMIDFETCMVAIPFYEGSPPYQQIAFQFSHHVIHEDGSMEHKSEYINTEKGKFPNFEFVRVLKSSLSNDKGSIFRYSNHENTVLCQIREQLLDSDETDKDGLIAFIETITTKKDEKKKILWDGNRSMIDLCELVKRYYYSPSTKGSNSIKAVLPAILNESKYLQDKYSKPIYNSKNFEAKSWIEFKEDGSIKDPYKLLDPVFDRWDMDNLDLVMGDEELANGGAALTAYAMMQFTHMSDEEHKKITEALLRYCELDTFAMVMIYEHWKYLINKSNETDKAA